MQSNLIQLDKLMLVGIATQTNNADEMDFKTAKIGALISCYQESKIADQTQNRIAPGIIYSVYTQYENGVNGNYTYFVGEAVTDLEQQNTTLLNSLIIPQQTYRKFTTDQGKMPNIVISAWQEIWNMDEEALGGKRNFVADFEVYDQRAADSEQAVVDIYIGLA